MSSRHLDLRPRRSPSPLGMRFVAHFVSKWHRRILFWIQTLLVHVEYIDAPSLDGMRWCDEVERTLNVRLMGERTWFDTGPRATNK